jgi:hypothetical protein
MLATRAAAGGHACHDFHSAPRDGGSTDSGRASWDPGHSSLTAPVPEPYNVAASVGEDWDAK